MEAPVSLPQGRGFFLFSSSISAAAGVSFQKREARPANCPQARLSLRSHLEPPAARAALIASAAKEREAPKWHLQGLSQCGGLRARQPVSWALTSHSAVERTCYCGPKVCLGAPW
jgi:hypothetical protein